MDYKFKRGFKPELERVRSVLEAEFPCEIRQDDDGKLVLGYGALKTVTVWVEEKRLNVVTESATEVTEEVILDTNKRFRNFLENATGYTAKQRRDMAKKEAQKS
jgi:hypothetical protein